MASLIHYSFLAYLLLSGLIILQVKTSATGAFSPSSHPVFQKCIILKTLEFVMMAAM